MKLLLTILFSFILSFCYAQQSEETFSVKSRVEKNKNAVPRIIDKKVGAVGDTICGSVRIDLTPAEGTYDSVSVFNLKIFDERMLKQNKRIYSVVDNLGHAIISLYKRQKNGGYRRIWFRDWVVHCPDRYLK